MSDSRIRVSRSLYLHALADAIDWEESFLASHDPEFPMVTGHCGPTAGTERCKEYRKAHDLLKRYRRAYAAVGGARSSGDWGTPVPLREIKENWPAAEAAATAAAREED